MLFSPPDKEISTIYCMVNYLMPSRAYLTLILDRKNCDWRKSLWLEKVGERRLWKGCSKVFLGGGRDPEEQNIS